MCQLGEGQIEAEVIENQEDQYQAHLVPARDPVWMMEKLLLYFFLNDSILLLVLLLSMISGLIAHRADTVKVWLLAIEGSSSLEAFDFLALWHLGTHT